MSEATNLAGKTFGFLKVVKRSKVSLYGKPAWVCRCVCGRHKRVGAANLVNGTTKSCGCQKSSLCRTNVTHQMTKTVEHRAWTSMLQRCLNKRHRAWKRYGARGIKVCRRWLRFENFFADMGKRPGPGYSLDRKKNHLGYSPENCRWATRSQQNKNRMTLRRDSLGRYA